MKNQFNINKIDVMNVADEIKGPIVYSESGCDPGILDQIHQILARLEDPELRKIYQRVDRASVNGELLLAIGNLQTQLDSFVKNSSQDRKTEILKLNETLTSEVQKTIPNREKVQISAAGLMAAAGTVAGMAEPIAKTVKVILSLIGV